MSKQYAMTIGGHAVGADQYQEIRNPANGEVVGLCPIDGSTQLDQAVYAARQAFGSCSRTDDSVRRDACQAIARIITANAPDLSVLLTQEQGKPLKGMGSEFELGGCAAWAEYTATLSLPIKVLEHSAKNRIELHRRPIGVVGSITPWNWPLLIAVWHILSAVRAGNTVVIKPSPFTPGET